MRKTHFVNNGTPPGMTRQTWIDSFSKGTVQLFLCEETGNVAIYLTRDPPGDPYPRQPVYHVWRGDDWMYCGQDAVKANKIYQKCKQRQKT